MTELKPSAPIRRFDVFAEYNRLKAMKEEKMSAKRAKGYGIWLAKVVAAQKFGRMPRPKPEARKEKEKSSEERAKKEWLTLGDIPQTDKLFDREIVNRMGKDFYSQVFSPAVQEAFAAGKPYVTIRDSIRKEWKP